MIEFVTQLTNEKLLLPQILKSFCYVIISNKILLLYIIIKIHYLLYSFFNVHGKEKKLKKKLLKKKREKTSETKK